MISSESNFMNIYPCNNSQVVDKNISSLAWNQNISGFVSLKLRKVLEFISLHNSDSCKLKDDNVENIKRHME